MKSCSKNDQNKTQIFKVQIDKEGRRTAVWWYFKFISHKTNLRTTGATFDRLNDHRQLWSPLENLIMVTCQPFTLFGRGFFFCNQSRAMHHLTPNQLLKEPRQARLLSAVHSPHLKYPSILLTCICACVFQEPSLSLILSNIIQSVVFN